MVRVGVRDLYLIPPSKAEALTLRHIAGFLAADLLFFNVLCLISFLVFILLLHVYSIYFNLFQFIHHDMFACAVGERLLRLASQALNL